MSATLGIDSMGPDHLAVLDGHRGSTCPFWLAWMLDNPLRRWFHDPPRLLGDFVARGDRVLELGPGPGFFTAELAKSVGAEGRVYCVDVQQAMLDRVVRKVERLGFGGRVEVRRCGPTDLGISDLTGTLDGAVLIYVLHEVPDPRRTLRELHSALRPGGRVLLLEPEGHCSAQLFSAELWAAEAAGFAVAREPAGGPRGRQSAILSR